MVAEERPKGFAVPRQRMRAQHLAKEAPTQRPHVMITQDNKLNAIAIPYSVQIQIRQVKYTRPHTQPPKPDRHARSQPAKHNNPQVVLPQQSMHANHATHPPIFLQPSRDPSSSKHGALHTCKRRLLKYTEIEKAEEEERMSCPHAQKARLLDLLNQESVEKRRYAHLLLSKTAPACLSIHRSIIHTLRNE